MVTAPRTRYAKCGDIDLAYQVLGDGPTDLLMLPGPGIPIDCIDGDPSMARFHRRLASFCRLIRFDQRGTGLSSRVPSLEVVGPRFWAQDALAVLDAVGIEQAAVFAASFSSMTASVLGAEHADRVRTLIIINGAARVLQAPDYPAGADLELALPFRTLATEPDAVERGFDALSIIAPSVAHDEAFRAWWDMSGNRAASPSMASAVTEIVVQSDVRDVLPRSLSRRWSCIARNPRSSTCGTDAYSPTYSGIALRRAAGADSLYWVGETGPMLDEIEEFLTGVRGGFSPERVLATVLFTDSWDRPNVPPGSVTTTGAICWTSTTRQSGTSSSVTGPGGQHSGGRVRGDVHQPQRGHRVRRGDR